MSQEIAFEQLGIALEATRFTAIVDPTHYANLAGTIVPQTEDYAPDESRGELEVLHRSVRTRAWGTFDAEGPLDVDIMPVLANSLVKGGVTSPSTPGGATNSRLWAFVPTLTADDLDLMTMFWGDPNLQIFRGAGGFIESATIAADASGTDGATVSLNGITQFPVSGGLITNATQANPGVITSSNHGLQDGDEVTITAVVGMIELNGNTYTVANRTANTFELSATDTSAFTAYTSGGEWQLVNVTFPSQVTGPLMPAIWTQIWIDTSSAIGTTEITGRVVSVETTIPSLVTPKYVAVGPTGGLSYTKVGRGKRSGSGTWVFELEDLTQFNQFRDNEMVKIRTRFNGALIETVGGVSFYNYVEVDLYGKVKVDDWGDLEGTNRTVSLVIETSIKDATLGASFRLAVQNDNTGL